MLELLNFYGPGYQITPEEYEAQYHHNHPAVLAKN